MNHPLGLFRIPVRGFKVGRLKECYPVLGGPTRQRLGNRVSAELLLAKEHEGLSTGDEHGVDLGSRGRGGEEL
jgi:hypothetical protein